MASTVLGYFNFSQKAIQQKLNHNHCNNYNKLKSISKKKKNAAKYIGKFVKEINA